MQIDAPTERDPIIDDLGRMAAGCRDKARMYEGQAEELLNRAQRERNKAARWDGIADYVRSLQNQIQAKDD